MECSLFVLVPVRNEEPHIESVIRDLRSLDGVNIVVVNDNSSDGTLRILNDLAVEYLHNRYQPGRDGSIKTGLEHYAENGSEDWVVIFDGDGQHSISFIEFVRASKPERTIFKGNRFSKLSTQINTPRDRKRLATELSKYLRKEYGILIEDVNCGLIGIPKNLLNWVLKVCDFDKHFSAELCIRVKLSKGEQLEMLEIAVPAIYQLDCAKHVQVYSGVVARNRFKSRYLSVTEKISATARSILVPDAYQMLK